MEPKPRNVTGIQHPKAKRVEVCCAMSVSAFVALSFAVHANEFIDRGLLFTAGTRVPSQFRAAVSMTVRRASAVPPSPSQHLKSCLTLSEDYCDLYAQAPLPAYDVYVHVQPRRCSFTRSKFAVGSQPVVSLHRSSPHLPPYGLTTPTLLAHIPPRASYHVHPFLPQ